MTDERPRATLITPEGTKVVGVWLPDDARERLSSRWSEKLGYVATLANTTWHFSGQNYKDTTENLSRRIGMWRERLFNNPSALTVTFFEVEDAVKAFAFSPEDPLATSQEEMHLLVDLRVQKLAGAINNPQLYLPLSTLPSDK